MAKMRLSAFQHQEPDADEYGGKSDKDADEPKKRTQKSVNYSKGTEAAHCGICKHFQPPHDCELVEGHIVPAWWCRLFAKAKVTGTMSRHLRGGTASPAQMEARGAKTAQSAVAARRMATGALRRT